MVTFAYCYVPLWLHNIVEHRVIREVRTLVRSIGLKNSSRSVVRTVIVSVSDLGNSWWKTNGTRTTTANVWLKWPLSRSFLVHTMDGPTESST